MPVCTGGLQLEELVVSFLCLGKGLLASCLHDVLQTRERIRCVAEPHCRLRMPIMPITSTDRVDPFFGCAQAVRTKLGLFTHADGQIIASAQITHFGRCLACGMQKKLFSNTAVGVTPHRFGKTAAACSTLPGAAICYRMREPSSAPLSAT